MTSAILQFAPLTVGPMNSVWPAAHIAYKDGKWVELVNDPVCIATFAQDQIGEECARLLAAAPDMMAALQNLLDQVSQMKGLFDDEDGTISGAIEDAETAIAKAKGCANG